MNAPAERIVTDVKVLASDIEELLKATATETGERVIAARARMEAALAQAGNAVVMQARHAADATDQYVHRNPWTAAGVAAAAGLVVGFLAGRR